MYCNLTANGRRTPARTRLDAGHIPEPEDVSLIAEALGIELCVVHSVEAAEIVNRGGSPKVHVLFRELVQADGTAKVGKAKAKVVG